MVCEQSVVMVVGFVVWCGDNCSLVVVAWLKVVLKMEGAAWLRLCG